MARRNAWLRPGAEEGAEDEALDLSPLEGDETEAEEEEVEVEAIVLFEPAPPATPLQGAGRAADEAAARGLFAEYQERLAPHTRRRQVADLARFVAYLTEAGVPVGDLGNDPAAWAGATWGFGQGLRALAAPAEVRGRVHQRQAGDGEALLLIGGDGGHGDPGGVGPHPAGAGLSAQGGAARR